MVQDEGYRRMAYVFYAAINRAIVADRIKPAADMTASENKFCDKEPGNGGFAGKPLFLHISYRTIC